MSEVESCARDLIEAIRNAACESQGGIQWAMDKLELALDSEQGYNVNNEPEALNFLDNIYDCWRLGGDVLERFMWTHDERIAEVVSRRHDSDARDGVEAT